MDNETLSLRVGETGEVMISTNIVQTKNVDDMLHSSSARSKEVILVDSWTRCSDTSGGKLRWARSLI